MNDNDISKAIHYPDCWDTVAYPTLANALWELTRITDKSVCSECKKEFNDI